MTNTNRKSKLEQFRREVDGLQNIVGVAYNPEEDELVALVSEKKAEEEVPKNQLVANNTSLAKDEHGVVEVGHIKAHSLRREPAEDTEDEEDREDESEMFEPESSAEFRPVAAGAEEQPDNFPVVGTGSFLAYVTDPSKGHWTDDVSEGTVVRLSNWHVYVLDEFEPHRSIHQPFQGGKVGELVGGVPIDDGVTVDVAARSISKHDGWGTVGLETADNGEEYGRALVADIRDEHAGATVTKSGRTTDVTTAEITLIDVSVNVDYGEPGIPHLVRIDDCVITSDLGDGGDSGSAVYLKESGALCGLYFAGSDVSGVFAQIGNVEEALGIEPITDWDTTDAPIEYTRGEHADELQQFKDDLITYIEEWRA